MRQQDRSLVTRRLETILLRMGIQPRKFNEFMKFGLVGTSGVAVNMGIFYALTRWVYMKVEFASPVAIEVSILSNFLLNNIWTFRNRETTVPFHARIIRYHLVTGLAGIVNYLILLLLHKLVGMPDLIANLIGIIAGMLINFFLNSLWTWRE